jgi:hypothetical protein
MLGAQVTVAATHATGRRARLEIFPASREEGLGEACEPRDVVRELAVRREGQQRVRVLGQRRVQRGGRVTGRGRCGAGVELGQTAADRHEHRVVLAAMRHAGRER